MVVVCGVLLLFFANAGPVKSMEQGSEAANDAFVQRWDAFCSDPDKATDLEWLAGFDAAANALSVVDVSWYYIESLNPER